MKKAICQEGKSHEAGQKFRDMGGNHELDGGGLRIFLMGVDKGPMEGVPPHVG